MTQAVIHTRCVLTPISSAAAVCSFGFTHVNTGTGSGRGDDTNLSSLRTAVKNTFTTIAVTPGHAIGTLIGSSISRGANVGRLEFTEVTGHLDGSPAGSPDYIETWTVPPSSGGSDLPEGVALVLSWHSAYGDDPEFGPGGDRPKQRDRNRMYIGPMNTFPFDSESSTNRYRLATAFGPALLTWFATMDDINGGPNTTWSLATWSKTANSVRTAVACEIDDRPDYQRRRSHDSIVTYTNTLP
jgi:hypothetical protein